MKIKLKYVFIWFIDQLRQPHWVDDLLLNRKAWGAFSVYSHLKRNDHKPQKAYPTKEKALEVAKKMSEQSGATVRTFKCLYCDGWHTYKLEDRHQKLANMLQWLKEQKIVYPTASALDTERIMQADIPDLAQAYGGFRGRTLSAYRQRNAWKPLVESGVRQVIDLREDYASDFYSEICKTLGLEYFYYPVRYEESTIERMVEQFPELCKKIDAGRFYISCANGLHRTDITLCLYWVFYAADKGVAPPPLCGYRQDKGRTTEKIRLMLDAFYDLLTQQTGKPPIPNDVFVKRKEVIDQLGLGTFLLPTL